MKQELIFGTAYYDEYMPYDRLDKDVEMMKAAGINTEYDNRQTIKLDPWGVRVLEEK